ncbi:unnamed protein product [Lampetra fluviatilis]
MSFSSLGVGTTMPGNRLPNASYPHQDESLEYEYYYEYDEISFDDLTVNRCTEREHHPHSSHPFHPLAATLTHPPGTGRAR